MALRLIIRGRVQGVFFRDWTVATARAMGLAGWVRNRADGSVEAHVEGDGPVIETFVSACHQGPPAARVDSVERQAAPDEQCVDFTRRPTA